MRIYRVEKVTYITDWKSDSIQSLIDNEFPIGSGDPGVPVTFEHGASTFNRAPAVRNVKFRDFGARSTQE